jgi:predicted GNAT family N-acyltransferase
VSSTVRSEDFVIARLARDHSREKFDCGIPTLDTYLREQAGQDLKRGVAVPYVITRQEDLTVAGFYTLSNISVGLRDLPEDVVKKLPRYPEVPATLLGRLAVDRGFRGLRLGERLLLDALERSLTTAAAVGSAAVIVDAKEGSAEFYEQYGFKRFPENRSRLFIPMKTIERLLPGK